MSLGKFVPGVTQLGTMLSIYLYIKNEFISNSTLLSFTVQCYMLETWVNLSLEIFNLYFHYASRPDTAMNRHDECHTCLRDAENLYCCIFVQYVNPTIANMEKRMSS